jgi:hypothetical protein
MPQNPFDQFDTIAEKKTRGGNPFDQFDASPSANVIKPKPDKVTSNITPEENKSQGLPNEAAGTKLLDTLFQRPGIQNTPAVSESTKQSLDPGKKPPNILDELASFPKGVWEGLTVQLPEAIGGSAEILNQMLDRSPLGELSAPPAASFGIGTEEQPAERKKRLESVYKPEESPLRKVSTDLLAEAYEKKAEYAKNPPANQFMYDLGQGASTLLTAFTTAIPATVVAGPVGGFTAGLGTTAMLEGGLAFSEAKQYGLSEKEAANVGLVVGGINGVLEMIPVSSVLKKTGLGRTISKEIAQEVINRGLYKNVAKLAGEQAGTEAITEFAQELTSLATESIYKRVEDKPELKDWLERAGYSALLGGILGGLTGIGGGVIQSKLQGAEQEKGEPLDEIEISAVIDELVRESLSPENAQLEARVPPYQKPVRDAAGILNISPEGVGLEQLTDLTAEEKERAGIPTEKDLRSQQIQQQTEANKQKSLEQQREQAKQQGIREKQIEVQKKADQDLFADINRQYQNAKRKGNAFDETGIAELSDRIQTPEVKTKLEGLYNDALTHNQKIKSKKQDYQTVVPKIKEATEETKIPEGGEASGLQTEEVIKEEGVNAPSPAKTYYRGIHKGNEGQADKFYSSSKNIAGEFAITKTGDEPRFEEIKETDLPKNIYTVQDKETLAEELGYNKTPFNKDFDEFAKQELSKQGYGGIRYEAGTDTEGQGVEEVHVFGKPAEEKVSSTQVNIPKEEIKPFIDYTNKIPEKELYTDEEGYGRETEPHVTALYGLKTKNPKDVESVIKKFGDVEIELGKTSLFRNDKYDVLKVDVKSEDLTKLNKLLRDKLDYKSDFPDYHPHLTIAYLKPGEGEKYVDDKTFEGKKFKLSELTFSPAEGGKTPLKLSEPVETKTSSPDITPVKKQEGAGKNLPEEYKGQPVFNQYSKTDKGESYTESGVLYKKAGTNKNGKFKYEPTLTPEQNKLRENYSANKEKSVGNAFNNLGGEDTGQVINNISKRVSEKLNLPVKKSSDTNSQYIKLPNGDQIRISDHMGYVGRGEQKEYNEYGVQLEFNNKDEFKGIRVGDEFYNVERLQNKNVIDEIISRVVEDNKKGSIAESLITSEKPGQPTKGESQPAIEPQPKTTKEDNNKQVAFRLFKEGKSNLDIIKAIGEKNTRAMYKQVRDWKKEYDSINKNISSKADVQSKIKARLEKTERTPETWQEAVLDYFVKGGKINVPPADVKAMGLSYRNVSKKGAALDKLISTLGFSDLSYNQDFEETRMIKDLLYKYDTHEKRKAALEQLKAGELKLPDVKELDKQYEKEKSAFERLDNIILIEYLDADGNLRTSDILKNSEDIQKAAVVDEAELFKYLKDKQREDYTPEPVEDFFSDFITKKEITSERAKEVIETSNPAELNKLEKDIRVKAESSSEAQLNEAIRQADELTSPLELKLINDTKKGGGHSALTYKGEYYVYDGGWKDANKQSVPEILQKKFDNFLESSRENFSLTPLEPKSKKKKPEQIQMEGLGKPSFKKGEEYLRPTGKSEETTPLFNQPQEVKGQENLFAEPASITNKKSFKSEIINKFNLPEEEAEAVSILFDARAEVWAKQNNKSKEDYYKSRIAEIRKGGRPGKDALAQIMKQTETKEFKNWFGDSKVVDEDGKPLVVYSGHANTPLYERYDPKKSTAGGFYSTEDPQVASNYALGKFGAMESFEAGSQYRVKGKNGKYNKKLWQITLTEEQKNKLDKLADKQNKYGDYVYRLNDMKSWADDNYQYDPLARKIKIRGIYDLQSIFEFNEQMGYNIAYAKQETEKREPYFERQQKNDTEEIMDALGIDWQSYDWNQPGVFPVFLSIKNPLDADKPFPQDLLQALKDAAKYERVKPDQYGMTSTQWTNEYPLKQWIADIESGDEFWTTQIPKKALPILKRFGYDGIKERGSKGIDVPREQRQINWIAFEPTQIKSAIANKGTFDPDNPDMLRQNKKGSVEFLSDNRAIIRALEQPDVSTVLHEIGHIFRRDIAGEDLNTIEEWANVKDGNWTREAEEKFARGFEKYLYNGDAPNEKLKSVFQKFKEWLSVIYKKIAGSAIDIKITPEVKKVFDNLFNEQSPEQRLRQIESQLDKYSDKNGTVLPEYENNPEVKKLVDEAEKLRKEQKPGLIFTEEEAAKRAKRLFDKYSKGLVGENSGFKDVFSKQDIEDILYIGGHFLEKGIRNFASWSKEMITNIGDVIKPHLEEVWGIVKLNSDVTALNKAEIADLRKELELESLEAPKRRSVERSLEDAKERELDKSALDIAEEVIRSKRLVDDAEHAGMVIKAKQLRDEFNSLTKDIAGLIDSGNKIAADKLQFRRDVLLEQLDRLTMASDMGGTELGRALNIRKMRIKGEGYDLASVMQRAKSVKGNKLSEKESKLLEELTLKYESAEKELEKLKTDYDKVLAEKEKLSAKRVTEREANRTRAASKADAAREKIIKERNDIKKQLKELGFRLNDVAGLSAEGSYLVGKLAINYIREGAVNLNEVVQKVLADLPDLTERDVYRALNTKDPYRQAKLKDEAYKKINQIKKHARLLEQIKSAEEGVFKEPQKKQPESAEIEKLRKLFTELRTEAYRSELDAKRLERALQTINELQDQLKNQYRAVRKRRRIDPPELIATKEKIKELRKEMNLDDRLQDLKEQVRTGDFKVKEKPEEKPLPPEIEKKVVEVSILRKRIRNTITELQPKTNWDKTLIVMDNLRTMRATLDMSSALRQGFFPAVRRPGLFMETQQQAMKAFFSEYSYEQIENNLKSDPNYFTMQKAGLDLTEIEGAINEREEMFYGNLVEKIPIYGQAVKASNRHMVTTLNLLRAGIFNEFVEKYPNATTEELKAWADYINVATGRGNLGKFAQAGRKLSILFFAPKFAVSRIQTPFMIFKYWSEPRIRKEIAKDYAAFGGFAITALALAVLAGAATSFDPDDPDFLKIKIGNTRIDMFAGTQQPLRLLLRIGKVATNKIGLTEAPKREESPLEMLYRFTSYKLAPTITVPHELLTGKTMVGEKREPWETGIYAVTPMVWEDTYDAYKDGGVTKAAWTSALNFFGMSTNTYEKKNKSGSTGGR